jgi:glycosyltransferase involved in cell wall biosynthesis
MKVLHITTVPVTLHFLRGQAAYMRRHGIDLSALSSPGEGLDSFGRDEGIKVYSVPMQRRISPLRDLVSLIGIIRKMRLIRPDLIHAHTPKAGLLGMIAAWFCGIDARIYQIHGLPFMTAAGLKRWLLMGSERAACSFARVVLCVSPSIRTVAIESGICTPEKAKVLAGGSVSGVDADTHFNPALASGAREPVRQRFGIPADSPVIGFVGRLVRDKGVAELVRAWLDLRENDPELHMLMVGPFEEQDAVQKEVRDRLEHDPRVHLAGVDWNMPPLYTAMDLLVLPTYREGLGMVLLEAAAMELPVVATNIPGCVDAVVSGVTGTLVPPRDAPALAAAIRTYLSDPALRAHHGAEGRRRVLREFRQIVVWEALKAEYQKLCRSSDTCSGRQ